MIKKQSEWTIDVYRIYFQVLMGQKMLFLWISAVDLPVILFEEKKWGPRFFFYVIVWQTIMFRKIDFSEQCRGVSTIGTSR